MRYHRVVASIGISVKENQIELTVFKKYNRGGVPMSFEAITSIADAEANAKAAVAAAELKSKQMLADAETAGKAAIEAAAVKAEEELTELRRKADEKAKTDAGGLSGELENKKAALRAKAEANLEKAAALVVERIVNN